MTKTWHTVEPPRTGLAEIAGLPGVRLEAIPVYNDPRGSLHELWRADEIPEGYQPQMACTSWSSPGVERGPHQHVGQDDYFTFAGPSDFLVVLWDARPGTAGPAVGWRMQLGQNNPTRIYVPRGVIHGYRNIGQASGLVVTVTNLLFRGWGRKEPVDEIRHECDPDSPYRFPET